MRDYAAREGYEALEEIVDPAQSGASLERPGIDRVRDLVATGGVRAVLAQDRDRFVREPAYLYLLKREFEEQNCRLKALNDHGDDSPEGELTDGNLDQLAKYERAKTAERTRRGKLRKTRQGKLIAGRRPNYGFKYNRARDGYEVDENTMPVIERIFRMAAMEGTDRRLREVVKECVELPGYEAFKYLDEEGDVKSRDLNAYVKEVVGDEGTPKDFRTWAGTLIAAVKLAGLGPVTESRRAEKNVLAAVDAVAERLGNPRDVARSSYISPRVINHYLEGSVVAYSGEHLEEVIAAEQDDLAEGEKELLKLLNKKLRRELREAA